MKTVLLVALVLASCLGSLHAADAPPAAGHGKPIVSANAKFKNVDPQQFEKLRSAKTNVVLDVRTPQEYAAGHIPGAINIDVNSSEFEKKVSGLDPHKTYLVHCASGFRSAKACQKLETLKFDQLYNLEGGMTAWKKAGNTPEK